MNILEIKNVSYSYNTKYQTVKAMDDISCGFVQGKAYAIVGKSGSGKSTMLSLLAGLDTPHEGQILFDGKDTDNMDLDEYRRNCAAVIYQDFKLFPLLTVIENICYPMELCKVKGKEARARAKELVKKVELPEAVLNRFPSMISGGEKQRVAIARALSMDRRLILADEPTGNLDSETGKNVIDILIRLAHEDNYCVIIATHDQSIIEKTDLVYTIKDGKIFLK